MDFSRLRTGELLAGLGGIALIGVMFLDWFGAAGASVPGLPDVSGIQDQIPGAPSQDIPAVDAWEALDFIGFILLLTGVTGIGLAVLSAAGRRANIPLTKGVAADVLGSLAVLLIIWRICDPPADGSLKVGVFLGLIAAAAVSVGGYLTARAEGFEFYPRVGGGGRSSTGRSSTSRSGRSSTSRSTTRRSTTRKGSSGGSRGGTKRRSTTRKG